MKQPCVYILANKPFGMIYIGVTSQLIQRLYQHRTNAIKGHTSKFNIHMLVRFELFGDMERAIAREKQLKNWHRSWKDNLIQGDNPHWIDLAVGLGLEPLSHA